MTNKQNKIWSFSSCDGFPLNELCRYDWTELLTEPYLVSLSFLPISFSPTLQSVYHLAMSLDYIFLKSLPEGFPINSPKIIKKAVYKLTYQKSICSWVIMWNQKFEWTVTLEVEMSNRMSIFKTLRKWLMARVENVVEATLIDSNWMTHLNLSQPVILENT